MLVIGMVAGAAMYLLYHGIDSLHAAGPALLKSVRIIQPVLLFAMLFLSFCKIEPRQMKLRKWMGWLLLVQGGLYILLAALVVWALHSDSAFAAWAVSHRLGVEAAMLCLICPTATACAVVTGKLGGDMAGVVSYTILINLLVSLMVPAIVPFLYPDGDMSFGMAFSRILARVFPLLIMPCLMAWMVRYLMPKLHQWLLKYTELSFYIWAVSLTLAIAMSTRAIIYNEGAVLALVEMAIASLVCCAFQFLLGKRIGDRYGYRITAGQSLGQKNTVFGIWMGYTFMNPVLSVTCGFYSIWHNLYNSWQLYRHSNGKPF